MNPNVDMNSLIEAVRLNKTSYLKVQFAVGIELPSSDEDEDTPFSQLAMQSSEVVQSVQPVEVT